MRFEKPGAMYAGAAAAQVKGEWEFHLALQELDEGVQRGALTRWDSVPEVYAAWEVNSLCTQMFYFYGIRASLFDSQYHAEAR